MLLQKSSSLQPAPCFIPVSSVSCSRSADLGAAPGHQDGARCPCASSTAPAPWLRCCCPRRRRPVGRGVSRKAATRVKSPPVPAECSLYGNARSCGSWVKNYLKNYVGSFFAWGSTQMWRSFMLFQWRVVIVLLLLLPHSPVAPVGVEEPLGSSWGSQKCVLWWVGW